MSWLREPDSEPIPGYRLISPLGTGGFGEVWKCEAPGNILKAIKFVYGNLNSLDGEAYRAEQEYKALQKVKEVRHPFVLSMEGIHNIDGELIIVMELADCSLHEVLQEHQAAGRVGIPRDQLLSHLRDAADGLDYINEKHALQHLDVKPRNLFLMGGRVKVADFGLVKNLDRQSTSGLMAGVTPIYAAPETFSGKFTKHSDQYSLAVVYVELLTGRRPFNGKNIRTLALQHVSEQPDLSGLPAEDRPVVARAMEKDPERRFPSCLAFVRALYEAGSGSEANLSTKPTSSSASTPMVSLGRRTVPEFRAPELADSSNSMAATNAQMEVGCLRPTIIIGVGEFGRRAILDLRCRLLDRFGDLNQVPVYRYLYVDSDPEAVHEALNDAPEIALTNAQVFPLPLQPVANYRRRALEHLNDWLPREKLYSIPRSLQPQGSRALGRLAFHDNYLRFMTRIRREMQIASHPESLAQAVSQTGMMLRNNAPRVIVIASACGGSGGLLSDLGYAVTRQLAQLHLPVEPPTLFMFCGAPADPATPPIEQANVHASLTELNHYCEPNTTFTAQYGPDGQHLSDTSSPFCAVYLLTMENRTPAAHRDCIAHLGNYLNHELTTALGNRLEQERNVPPGGATVFRSLGTHSIWFPRGLLLRVAARYVCDRLIGDWQDPNYEANSPAIDSICADALSDPGLSWESLAAQIEKAARSTEGTPPEIVSRLLAGLNEEANRP
jgi:serine/threonine protein kinase